MKVWEFPLVVICQIHLADDDVIYCSGGCLLISFCEIGEVVGSLEHFSAFPEFVNVKVMEQEVSVLPHLGISWLECISDRCTGKDLNVIWQGIVYLIHSHFLFGLETDNVSETVHTSVCTAGYSESGFFQIVNIVELAQVID